MSDVHKAAIRYRTGYTETYEQRTGRRYPNEERERDANTLALAYLAEHPADENEPVTEDWLASVGPPEDETISIATFQIPTEGMYGGALDFRKNGQVHLCGSRLRYPPKTRGELRTLARALGITLTEAKQ